MTARLKTILAITSSIFLAVAVWSAPHQIKSILFGLALGVIGVLFIFAAEFLYTYRKDGKIQIGSVRTWLRLHIAAGITGPLVILWHTGLNFHGFAGWLTGLTAIVTVSGFIGRYIYRRIPRSLKGKALSLAEIDKEIAEMSALLANGEPTTVAPRSMRSLKSRRAALQRRVSVLGASKDLLSRWRAVHIPLTLTLLVGVLIHVGSVLYYGKVLP